MGVSRAPRGDRPAAFRIEGPSEQPIASLADWLEHAPPKKRDKHWKPGRSARELARAWLDDGLSPTLPAEIAGLLDSHELTRDFMPGLAIPEYVTRLDDFEGEHRNHGYLVFCERREKERPAKVRDALAARRRPPDPSNARRRIEQLCRAIFGPPARSADVVRDSARPLRYQLVAALAGALIEARARKCTQAVLVVHEFLYRPDVTRGLAATNPAKVARNDAALDRFLTALTGHEAELHPGTLVGPLDVPGDGRVPGDMPFFAGKVVRRLN